MTAGRSTYHQSAVRAWSYEPPTISSTTPESSASSPFEISTSAVAASLHSTVTRKVWGMASSALKASAEEFVAPVSVARAKHPAPGFILLLEDLIDAGRGMPPGAVDVDGTRPRPLPGLLHGPNTRSMTARRSSTLWCMYLADALNVR